MVKKLGMLLIVFVLTGCISLKTRNDMIEQTNRNKNVSFIAVGDNLIHKGLINEAYDNGTYNFTSYYENIKPYIEKYDLSFINQETILGGKEFGYSGYPLFNTPDEMADALSDTGFDIINGSNNHALDMGEKGVNHAIEVFKKYENMTYIGLKQTNIPVVEKNGIKIAFLAYNESLNGNTKSASIKSFDKHEIENDVEEAKKISDCIIVSCHWGNEYDDDANDFQKEYAQFLADLGVDVIIGSHSHTLQSVEWVEGKDGHVTLVAYSLGNFLSGMMEEDTQLGGMLSFNIEKKDDNIMINDVLLTPLINHYQVKDKNNRMNTRYGFQVYRLKDYTDELANQHGLNGYKGIEISIERMKNKVRRSQKEINVDM